MSGGAADPFGTSALREAVLQAWAASPARFREDANAEEDLARGGYRDRLVVELLQNAADAAVRAGVAGRVLLRRRADRLVVASTGSPLDRDGVVGLSSLRASAKRERRDGLVGRFGVGFSAVLAVTDAPAVASRSSGGVRFDREATLAAVRRLPQVAPELAARDGHVPVLRLPWPAEVPVPEGYDTVVELPFRDEEAARLADRLLDEVDDALLLALPALVEVRVEGVGAARTTTVTRTRGRAVVASGDEQRRWRTATAAGALPAALLADRPVEERSRPWWSLTWAAAEAEDGRLLPHPPGVAAVLHAPTPSAEPLALPALLVASLPMDPTRRHVAEGPLLDWLVERAAEAYATLAAALAAERVDVSPLVPAPVAVGSLDAAVRRAVVARLRRTPLLPAAEDDGVLLRPDTAVTVEGSSRELADVLGEVLAGLVRPGWARQPLDVLGVRRMSVDEVVDELGTVKRPPAWWRGFYAAAAGQPADTLASVPVPLLDGRTVRGARGCLLPRTGLAERFPASAGLRVVHPAADHPVLERLGAVPDEPDLLLADARVAAAVETAEGAAVDGATDAEDLAAAVLAVLEAGSAGVGDHPWLARLPLPDDGGNRYPAGDLVLPGSLAGRVLDDVPVAAEELVQRWGGELLQRVGVASSLSVVRAADVLLDPDELDGLDVDGLAEWAEDCLAGTGPTGLAEPVVLPELAAVRDLDLVREDSWAEVLAALSVPPLREAVVDRVRAVDMAGRRVDLPSPASWWLRRHARLGGGRPRELALPGSELDGLYPPMPDDLDEPFAQAVGVRTTVVALLAEPGGAAELLDRVATTPLDPARLRAVYEALGRSGTALERPGRLRVPDGASTRLVGGDRVVVVDAPMWLPLARADDAVVPLVVGDPAAVADALDLDLASDRLLGPRTSGGARRDVPEVVRPVLGGAVRTWVEHDELDAGGVPLDWWVDSDVHACTTEGLAQALAWTTGRWRSRHLLLALLTEPDRRDELLDDAVWDG